MFDSSVTQPARLGPVPEDADAKSHHVKNSHGQTTKFRNPHASYADPKISDIFRILLDKLTGQGELPKPKGDEMEPIRTPEFLPTRDGGGQSLRATWLGHACYYVEFPSGLRVLFDPVFEDSCSPIPFPGYDRFSRPACSIADLPFVDAVVISHNHYDHLSYPTVQEIRVCHPQAHFLVSLGLKDWFEKSGVDGAQVTECDWWEDVELTLTPKPDVADSDRQGTATLSSYSLRDKEPITAVISCLPSQHRSARGILDRNLTLWCSWAVSSSGRSVYFVGDSGYRRVPQVAPGEDTWAGAYADLPRNPQFAQIGTLRGPFDLGLIPIGAYKPRHMTSGHHADPYDAVEIFTDARCKRAMAIHWGTWVLTEEEVLEPPRLLKEALREKRLPEEGVFDTCRVGETREF